MMKAYLNPYFFMLLWWSMWTSAPQGAGHPVSRCPSPTVEQERSET
jgi:hypothetical protein